jgi:cation diffusion facilitator family transporter
MLQAPIAPGELTPAAPSADSRKEVRAAAGSLLIGLALLIAKFVVYFLTSSTAVFSEALESMVNVLAASLTLYAIVLAHAPADWRHPYGHGKAEFITAAFEGGMLLAAGIAIIVRSIELLITGAPVQRLEMGLIIVLSMAIISGTLGVAMVRRGKASGSLAIEAVGHQFTSDAVTTVIVLIALIAVKLTGRTWLDPVGGLAMAAYVCYTAAMLMRRSFAGLMDEQDIAEDAMLRRLLDSHIHHDGVSRSATICSYHKLRHRHSGRYHWVDFHLVVPGDWSIEQGHRVATRIETEIEKALGDANATAHVEPCSGITCPFCPAKSPDQVDTKHPRQGVAAG